MKELTIGSKWIFEHKTLIPWNLLVGAEIETESGQLMKIVNITTRDWPTGPLIDVIALNQNKNFTYNIEGFRRGLLRSVIFKAPITENILSLVAQVENRYSEYSSAEKMKQDLSDKAEEIARASLQAAAQDTWVKRAEQVIRDLEQHKIFEEQRAAQEIQRRSERIELLKQRMLTKQSTELGSMTAFVKIHRIPYLVHFTRIENLPSIMEHGIVSRSELPPGFVTNDDDRADEFLEASCLSVGFPNWKLFFKQRCREKNVNWAVLTISTDALTALPCLFHSSNAANKQFRDKSDQALESRMGVKGLQTMFYDEPAGLRAERALAPYWTTDPQAEVLVFKTIPMKLITSVTFLRPNAGMAATVSKLAPSLVMSFNGQLFRPRSDYQYWQSNRSNGSEDFSAIY